MRAMNRKVGAWAIIGYALVGALAGCTTKPEPTPSTSTGPTTSTSGSGSLGPFQLSSPDNRSTRLTLPVTFSWTKAAGAATYRLQVAVSTRFAAPLVLERSGLTNTSLTVADPLSPAVVYYWRVLAVAGTQAALASNAPAWFSVPFRDAPRPHAVAVTPDGSTLYVANDNSAGDLTVYSLTTHALLASLTTGSSNGPILATADGSKVLVANGDLVVVGTATRTIQKTIRSACSGHSIAYTMKPLPDGRVLVHDMSSGCDALGVRPYDLNAGPGTFIDLHGLVVVSLAVDPGGTFALAAITAAGKVLPRIDLRSSTVTNIPDVAGSWSVLMAPDGRSALVATNAGTKRLNLTTNALGPVLARGAVNDASLAVSRDGSKYAVLSDFHLEILRTDGDAKVADYDLAGCTGITFTPDGSMVVVADDYNHLVRFYPVPS